MPHAGALGNGAWMTAYQIINPQGAGPWVLSCDHATNHVPDWVNLGVPAQDMARHIAYDPGALGVTRHLADLLDGAAVAADFSRLVIDPNRGVDDPTLIMRIYDGSIIAGNRKLGAAERRRRVEALYTPYHDALARVLAARPDAGLCAIHSFTPQLRGRPPRPWHIGVLWSRRDPRLAPDFIAACRAEGWCVGDNQPYSGDLAGDSIDRHALQSGRPNLLIEIRNDLIADAAGQYLWAQRLAPLLQAASQSF